MRFDIGRAERHNDHVDPDLFGANMLFDRDRIGAGGSYDDALRSLAVSNVRYPGGTITEWYFDIADPDATSVWDPRRGEVRELLPLSEFLAWAGRQDLGVTLVIPTASLLAPGRAGERRPEPGAWDAVQGYVADVLEGRYGTARIEAIEIGNEYWLGGEMDAGEYTRIASVIASAAQAAIDAHVASGVPRGWQEPDIAVQIGQYGRFSTDPGWIQNAEIMDGLSDAAARAIDAVVAHYYVHGDYEDIARHDYYFDRLDDWTDDRRFRDLEYHVTEWNMLNDETAETGLRQGAAMLHMVSEMVTRGVDAAHVWPVQQNNATTLSGDEGQTALSLAGEAFRMISEATAGGRLTRRLLEETGALYVYEDGPRTIVYVASRADGTETFRIDTGALGLAGQTHWSVTLGTAGRVNDPRATPELVIDAGSGRAGETLALRLDPFEVARVIFHEAPAPGRAQPTGPRFPDPLEGSDHGDRITGSALADRIDGRHGADRIVSGAGRDTVEGGGGADTLNGGGGADELRGGAGDDRVAGGAGADRVWLGGGADHFLDGAQSGVAGADTVFGGAGNDRLEGRGGADRLHGERGRDTLEGGAGADRLAGGQGSDRLAGGAGSDLLLGGAQADRLEGGDGRDILRGNMGRDTLHGGAGRDTLDGGMGDDLLIGGSGRDVFLIRAGAGRDTLQGFEPGDMLDLRGIDPGGLRLIARGDDAATLFLDGARLELTDLSASLAPGDILFF